MFREMRRFKQKVSRQVCDTVLASARRGVLSVIGDDGYPYGVPVDFYYDREEGVIYIHCAGQGHKFDAVRDNGKVCFTTWDEGFRKPDDWAWNVTSVITFGHAILVDDREKVREKLDCIGRKYYPEGKGYEHELDTNGLDAWLIAITVEHMTGKVVNES